MSYYIKKNSTTLNFDSIIGTPQVSKAKIEHYIPVGDNRVFSQLLHTASNEYSLSCRKGFSSTNDYQTFVTNLKAMVGKRVEVAVGSLTQTNNIFIDFSSTIKAVRGFYPYQSIFELTLIADEGAT